jgi:hypothetical protein
MTVRSSRSAASYARPGRGRPRAAPADRRPRDHGGRPGPARTRRTRLFAAPASNSKRARLVPRGNERMRKPRRPSDCRNEMEQRLGKRACDCLRAVDGRRCSSTRRERPEAHADIAARIELGRSERAVVTAYERPLSVPHVERRLKVGWVWRWREVHLAADGSDLASSSFDYHSSRWLTPDRGAAIGDR